MDANTNAVKVMLRMESAREKEEGLTAFRNAELSSSWVLLCKFASENYLLRSVMFGSLCAGSGDRQLVCSDGKASTIIR